MLSRSFEVCRLTRPARLRCRPLLAALHRYQSTAEAQTARQPTKRFANLKAKPLSVPAGPPREVYVDSEIDRWIATSSTPKRAAPFTSTTTPKARARPVKRKTEGDDDRIGMLGRRLREQADYEQAKQLQEARLGAQGNGESSKKAASKKSQSHALPTLRKPKSFQHTPPSTIAGPSTDKGKAPLRRNPVGVQLLSPSLHRQLFPGPRLAKPKRSLVGLSTQHLADNGLKAADAAVLDEINMDLPPLQGSDIREHFVALGQMEAEPYMSMAKQFVETALPPMPEVWVTDTPGWIKYHEDGSYEPVEDLGDETMVSFDVEVLYKISPYPVIATAVTPNAWYSWLCPTILEDPPTETPDPLPRWNKTIRPHLPHDLVPLFSGKTPRVVIGHNVGYDRARIKEEYNIERTSTRYLDTLALHVATRGITSVQRPAWMNYRKYKQEQKNEEEALKEALIEHYGDDDKDLAASLASLTEGSIESDAEEASARWEDITTVNSLAEVARLHCGIPVDKSIRNRFGDADITHASHIRAELHDLIAYCASDVKITHEVYKKTFPLFLQTCPHPASFAGVLSMGNSFLPVNDAWAQYIRNAEEKYRELEIKVKRNLRTLAEKLRRDGPSCDPWASQLDWTPKKARWVDEGPNAPEPAVEALKLVAAGGEDLEGSSPGSSSSFAPDNASTTSTTESAPSTASQMDTDDGSALPAWLVYASSEQRTSTLAERALLPLVLRMSYLGYPVVLTENEHWCFRVPKADGDKVHERYKPAISPARKDVHLYEDGPYDIYKIGGSAGSRKLKIVGSSMKKLVANGSLTSPYQSILEDLVAVKPIPESIGHCILDLQRLGGNDPWGSQLDWTKASEDSVPKSFLASGKSAVTSSRSPTPTVASQEPQHTWPKWYHDLSKTVSQLPAGELDITQKKILTPLLLRMQWLDYPLFHSKEFKWIYRVPRKAYDGGSAEDRLGHGTPLTWANTEADVDPHIRDDQDHYFFRLPHQGGEGKNVGSPLAKGFSKYLESGKLSSGGPEDVGKIASGATQMNVLCSYWMSARERIIDQMVVYDSPSSGMILPQVITMGTVTRRAVESTWLTASNAKKNRVGSELKAMVRAPPGYSIVGADVDSEELWISSVMGDSQFGMHGATAIGWMTLEGTKSNGTDLHSKTASILGTSRDAAKVFNYSRIYGAGVNHAVQLLMQGDATLTKETATTKAKALYSATKGDKAVRSRKLPLAPMPSLWHGGSESFLFNTLEAIALSDRPTTPALGCGVTKALSKLHLTATDTFLPSRINWVVQSSGVDYLHLLIVSMEYLIKAYGIQARYLISVHDEVRYLAKEEDRYRTALALQIANAWTRALFCYNLGIDDVPQGVTFFSAVDVDHVLRKEVFMGCATPSHPTEIPPGESLDMAQLLEKTSGGQLGAAVKVAVPPQLLNVEHRGTSPDVDSPDHFGYLQAQADRRPFRARQWLDGQDDLVDTQGHALPSPWEIGKDKKQKKEFRKEKLSSLWDEIKP